MFKDVTFSLCPHVEEGEGIALGVIYKVTDLDHEGSTHNSSLCKAAPSIVLHWGGGEHSDDDIIRFEDRFQWLLHTNRYFSNP